MSSKSHNVLLLFAALCMYGFTIPSWSNLQMIQLGFFICAFLANIGTQLVITPMKHEAMDEELELEAEIRLISYNDTDGWSQNLRDKKRQKIIALTKKIDCKDPVTSLERKNVDLDFDEEINPLYI